MGREIPHGGDPLEKTLGYRPPAEARNDLVAATADFHQAHYFRADNAYAADYHQGHYLRADLNA